MMNDSANAYAGDPTEDTVPEAWDGPATNTPPLARGLRWSDVVADIERDNMARHNVERHDVERHDVERHDELRDAA
jgi:hypothetical protein